MQFLNVIFCRPIVLLFDFIVLYRPIAYAIRLFTSTYVAYIHGTVMFTGSDLANIQGGPKK